MLHINQTDMPHIFCDQPFTRVHISTNGNVFTCCSAWINNKAIGNAFSESFDDIWNSPAALDIRRSILDGSFMFCNKERCHKIVSGGIHNREVMKTHRKIITHKTIQVEKGPTHFSLNYDNSCNIYCATCRDKIIMLSTDEVNQRIEFQRSLLQSDFMKDAERFLISGTGEVFFSKVYMDLFNTIEQACLPHLKITLRTNGLLLTPSNWQRISNVHYAIDIISISIDAARHATYEKLRRGGSFSKLLKNLEFASQIKKNNKIRVEVNFVVQDQNYKEMKEFVDMAKRYGFDKVVFAKIANRGTYSREEYHRHAIHQHNHPEFESFASMLKDPVFKDRIIYWANLSHLTTRASSDIFSGGQYR